MERSVSLYGLKAPGTGGRGCGDAKISHGS